MDKKAGVYDFESIYASIQELRKANASKPRCPRPEGACLSPCHQMSDCFNERATPTSSVDF